MNYLYYALIAACGYIIGSLSPAVYMSRKYAGYDIRQMGSKNAGSTNVFRVMGPKWGVINFILDFMKGLLPALAGYLLLGETGAIAAGAGVVTGHAFPLFSKFRGGGKCVASSTGIMMVLSPWITLAAFVIAVVIVLTTRYVSLASITIFTLYPVISFLMPFSSAFRIFICMLGALILLLHRENIVRLIRGTENPLLKSKK